MTGLVRSHSRLQHEISRTTATQDSLAHFGAAASRRAMHVLSDHLADERDDLVRRCG